MRALGRFGLKSFIMAGLLLSLLGHVGFAAEYGFAPVSGQMTSPFGWRVDPITGSQRFHGGVDLAASSGMPVYAPQAGQVMFSGAYGGYGNVVVLNHGNSLYTLYGHNSQLLVKAGDSVYRGQVISLVGSTGRSTGPHLHFEVHHNGQYVNPVTYLAYLQPYANGMTLAQVNRPVTMTGQSSTGESTKKNNGTVTQINRRKSASGAKGRKVVELVNGNEVETIQF